MEKGLSISRKVFKEAMMPAAGTVINDIYVVSYTHYGKFRFTARVKPDIERPPIGDKIEWQSKLYEVTYYPSDKTFSGEFRGFIENPAAADVTEEIKNVENIETGQEPTDFGGVTTLDGPPDISADEDSPTEEHGSDCVDKL
jgi:hypothetical protein